MTSTVIVVSHRPGDWLAPCLRSVVDQADEVILVDNGSAGEGASDIGRRYGARVIRATGNLGFAAGVNLGVKHATGEIVGLLNDDAVAGERWLASAAKVLEVDDVAAVTPKVLLSPKFARIGHDGPVRVVTRGGTDVTAVAFSEPGWVYVPLIDANEAQVEVDGEPLQPSTTVCLLNHAGMHLHRHGFAGDYGLGAADDGRFDQPAERFGCSGAAPVFRAETLANIGGFEERFFAYNEDTDWCFRARLAGMRILYDPSATVSHRMSATSGGNSNLDTQLLTRRNQVLTLVRNAPARVVAEHLSRVTFSPHRHGVRAAVAGLLPWAIASRRELRRKWVLTPHEVWGQWAGLDNVWDPPWATPNQCR